MSEIEKMYNNAEVKKQIPKVCSNNELYCKECEAHIEDAMLYCKNAEYPPFIAKKQLELIKWLTKNDKFHCLEIEFFIKEKDYKISTYQKASNFNEDFTETLASLINNLWQDLTPQQKQQVKGILE